MIIRHQIRTKYELEGFFSIPSQKDELAKLNMSNVPAAIINVDKPSLPLKQYCIKAAYNAAFTGHYINTEMLKYVFYRGCRFLDFEVFSFDKTPYVAYSTKSDYSVIESKNKELLQEILSQVANYAFTSPSPNTRDPVFIHLRIKTNQTSLYDKIGEVINHVLKPQMFLDSNTGLAKPVNGDTPLRDIMGKVIIVLDKTYVPTYKQVSSLANYVNMESGGDSLRKYSYSILSQQQYSTPNIHDDGKTTDVSVMKLVMPNLASNMFGTTRNSQYYPMVLNYGAQIVMYPFYQVDMYLSQYEQAFAYGKSAFIPLAQMMLYLESTIGKDEPQNPSASVEDEEE